MCGTGKVSRSRLALLFSLSLLGSSVAALWAEEHSPATSSPQSPPPSSTELPQRTPLEIASELYKRTGTLADGLTALATESEMHTSEQENDTRKASELVKDSKDMQNSRDTATNSLGSYIDSSQKAGSSAEKTIMDQAVALSAMKRSRDFWRTSTMGSVLLGAVLVLVLIL